MYQLSYSYPNYVIINFKYPCPLIFAFYCFVEIPSQGMTKHIQAIISQSASDAAAKALREQLNSAVGRNAATAQNNLSLMVGQNVNSPAVLNPVMQLQLQQLQQQNMLHLAQQLQQPSSTGSWIQPPTDISAHTFMQSLQGPRALPHDLGSPPTVMNSLQLGAGIGNQSDPSLMSVQSTRLKGTGSQSQQTSASIQPLMHASIQLRPPPPPANLR